MLLLQGLERPLPPQQEGLQDGRYRKVSCVIIRVTSNGTFFFVLWSLEQAMRQQQQQQQQR